MAMIMKIGFYNRGILQKDGKSEMLSQFKMTFWIFAITEPCCYNCMVIVPKLR